MNYVDKYLDDIRSQIAPDDLALKEAEARRELIRGVAEKFHGALRSFCSGSLAHRTANCPVHRRDAGLDADCGLVLDRRIWSDLGPDGAATGPNGVVADMVQHLTPKVRSVYPDAVLTPGKRAILVEFQAPLPEGEDPTVDLVVALDRRGQPGLWIPNTERNGWDPSHPEMHTAMLTAEPKALRLVRQHAIRLAKAENKREECVPLCSFNLEAFGLMFVRHGMNDADALEAIWAKGLDDLRRRLTPDPARVSADIKVEDHDFALRRLASAHAHLAAARSAPTDEEHVRRHLHALWPDFVASHLGGETKARLVVESRRSKPTLNFGAVGLTTGAAAGAAAVATTVRSYGQV